jgi:hypothetical protein
VAGYSVINKKMKGIYEERSTPKTTVITTENGGKLWKGWKICESPKYFSDIMQKVK